MSRNVATFPISLLLLLSACGGSGSTDSSSAADRPQTATPERCIIFVNGNKLCGEDAKAWCRNFQPTDVQGDATCDFILERPPPAPRLEDFASKRECMKELPKSECEALGFMTDEEMREFDEDAKFVRRLGRLLGSELSQYVGGSRVVGEGTSRDGSLVLLTPNDLAIIPPTNARNEICRRVLAMPGVEDAAWELIERTDPC